jgi:hypothetical protein
MRRMATAGNSARGRAILNYPLSAIRYPLPSLHDARAQQVMNIQSAHQSIRCIDDQ